MLGVVLWSDNSENKAVIWCEDHGDLAFFNGGAEVAPDRADLDAGDLVQFELQQEKHLRYARNPKRSEEAAYSGIATRLQDAAGSQQYGRVGATRTKPAVSAHVIPFTRHSTERADRELLAV